MSTVAIPNEIRAGQPLDPRPVMANFNELALFINDDVLTLDGSKAMTGHLTLSGPGVAGGHAVTKAQLDDALGGDVDGGGYLPLAGGTLTGKLNINHKGGQTDPSLSFHSGANGIMGLYSAYDDRLRVTVGGLAQTDFHDGLFDTLYDARVRGDLQVDGAASIGSGKRLDLNGNWAEVRLSNSTSSGRHYMVIGNSNDGAQINLYGDSDSSGPGNVLFYAGSQTVGRWDGPTGMFVAYRDAEVRGDLTVKGQVLSNASQTQSAPHYSFTHARGSGMYGIANGHVKFATNGTSRFEIGDDKITVGKDLQVDGQITTGAGKAVRFGGNWDGAFIASVSSSGREYMNFGENADGGARLRLYGPGDSSYPGNAYIYGGGDIAARFDKDQNTKLYSALTVGGTTRAANGTKAAPAYSFTSDTKTGLYLYSKGIASITCDGKNIANFGTAGVSFPEGLATISAVDANLHIDPADGQIRRIVGGKSATTADVERLETLVEKLSATVDGLTAKVAALVARVDASESIK